jgi:acylphosphatase
MIARRYLVSGTVQGVGFRWFAARTARGLGLSGFARNLEDGRVEVVASGTEAAVAELAAALAKGPPAAAVTSVEASEMPVKASSGTGFAIK